MASGSERDNPNASGHERKFSTGGESLYKILNLEKGATPEQIKKAYRKLALQYHPDKNPDPSAAEKIKELNRANHVLGDEKRKAIYDKYGSVGLQIASQFGEDNVAAYFMLDNVCCKILIGTCFVLTGCCCCCCCCCCCGKCLPRDEENANYAYYQAEADSSEPVTTQPGASDERTHLTSDQETKQQYQST